jgi:hypothetical protein
MKKQNRNIVEQGEMDETRDTGKRKTGICNEY